MLPAQYSTLEERERYRDESSIELHQLLVQFFAVLQLALARVSAFKLLFLIHVLNFLIARAVFVFLPLQLTSLAELVLPLIATTPKVMPPRVLRPGEFLAVFSLFLAFLPLGEIFQLRAPFRLPKALPVHLLIDPICPIQLFG